MVRPPRSPPIQVMTLRWHNPIPPAPASFSWTRSHARAITVWLSLALLAGMGPAMGQTLPAPSPLNRAMEPVWWMYEAIATALRGVEPAPRSRAPSTPDGPDTGEATNERTAPERIANHTAGVDRLGMISAGTASRLFACPSDPPGPDLCLHSERDSDEDPRINQPRTFGLAMTETSGHEAGVDVGAANESAYFTQLTAEGPFLARVPLPMPMPGAPAEAAIMAAGGEVAGTLPEAFPLSFLFLRRFLYRARKPNNKVQDTKSPGRQRTSPETPKPPNHARPVKRRSPNAWRRRR